MGHMYVCILFILPPTGTSQANSCSILNYH